MKKAFSLIVCAAMIITACGNTDMEVIDATENTTVVESSAVLSTEDTKAIDEADEGKSIETEDKTDEIGEEKETSNAEGSMESEENNADQESENLMSEDEFFEDILASYSARNVVATKYTNAEIKMMSNKENVEWILDCIAAEDSFAEKYKDAKFDDLNIQYLCAQYIKGLDKQRNAANTYLSGEDTVDSRLAYTNENMSGYYNRAYVIVELNDYFDVPFPSEGLSEMRKEVDKLEKTNEAETRNKSVPKQTVKEVQTLLHLIGFRCWNIDGAAGKKTVRAIKRFQEMYGYETDGMITDELIEQLKSVAEEKGLDWQEAIENIK